jgi:PAS domain S-box-containing protein
MAAFIAEGKAMKTKSIEMDQPHKDGHIVNTEVVITVLPDQTGNPSQILGVSRDITERKKTEEQMMLQSSALEAVANGIVITDPNGIIEWVNPAFSALTGYRLEEAVGRNPRDLVKSGIHDEDYYRNMWITITAGKVWQGELTNRRKDGSFYTEEQTITPIHDIRGRISHFIGVKQDITERKKAAEELIESEANLDVILKSTADGILAVDTNGKIIRTNPQFYDLWQIPESIRKSEDEALLHFVLDQLTDPEAFLAKVKILYQSDNIDTDLLQFKDGRVFERFSAPLLMKKNLLGRVWSFRDITQRKKAEDALRESEEKYKAFFEDDLTGDFISTPDGRLLACNLPFAKIFGYESVDAIMQASAHSLYPDPKVRDMLMKRLTRERRIEYYSSELLRKDGKKVYVIENLIGKFDKKGKLIEFKGYLFDDTNRRNLEHQLIQAQKMESLGTLAGGIAHDFNNILAIILGHNSLIRRKFADNEYIAENAETIAKATQRGAGMVKQLLTFAKKSDVVLESILIQDIINEIRKFIEQTFPKTITIQTKCEKDLPPMVADATQIHQVLLNLCINARDAMPHGGQLSISAVRINALEIQEKVPRAYSPAYIYITVSDSGTGMDEATRIRIFEPFFTTKGRERGTGLGLATVYGIVEAHHGVIEVQSEIGKGSSFHIYFPVQQSFIEHRTAETGSEEIAGGNETILVVDDEESMKTLLSAVFKEKGYTVITASDGQEALDIYRQRHAEINIVLTDMGLPKLGGEEVVSGIKKINKDARIIVASGYFEKAIKTELAKSGVKDFVQKPYLPDEILQKVREVLDLK